MKKTPTDQMLVPEHRQDYIVCGHTLIGWENAIVYVRNKHNRNSLPTHLHFNFTCKGEAFTSEVVRLVDQWTWYPGHKCYHYYNEGTHEYYRARKEAIKAVETYRRNYMAEHGQPPDVLFKKSEEFTREQIERATTAINRKSKGSQHPHVTNAQLKLDL